MPPPPLPYIPVAESSHLPPGMNFGGTSGVAFNSRGHIFIIYRGAMPVMAFDPEGHFIRHFGNGKFVRPHRLRIEVSNA